MRDGQALSPLTCGYTGKKGGEKPQQEIPWD